MYLDVLYHILCLSLNLVTADTLWKQPSHLHNIGYYCRAFDNLESFLFVYFNLKNLIMSSRELMVATSSYQRA